MWDTINQLEDISRILRDSDVTFLNLEGPICDLSWEETGHKCNGQPDCFEFRTPTRYAAYLAEAGVKVV